MIKTIEKYKNKCCGCGSCFNSCPKQCITMSYDEEGFLYPKVNLKQCVSCGLCDRVCPIDNSAQIEVNENIESAFAAINNDESVRAFSSSGGLFYLFAKRVLDRGGFVFAPSLDERFFLRHIRVDNTESLFSLLGAKYIQSDLNSCFKTIKDLLINQKYVYFSGTPCQVEALLLFLGKKYDNLFTQDIVCHGVPSLKSLQLYLRGFNKVDSISFRNKSSGWRNYSVKIGNILVPHNECSFIKAFIDGYIIRPSCYDCAFKKIHRASDITLGDLWGVEKITDKFDDDKGVSLLVINSTKGKKLFEEIRDDIRYSSIDLNKAIEFNPSYIKSTNRPKNRSAFQKDIQHKNFDYVVFKKYSRKKFITKAKGFIRRIIYGKQSS